MGQDFLITASGDAAKGFLFSKMLGHESLGQLFDFDVELLSEDPSIDLSTVVGKPITLQMELATESVRYFNGLVTRIKLTGTATERYTRYEAKVRPAFWLLTRTSNSRIFQRMTVPNIVKQIFRDRGLADFDDKLSGTYRTWEFLVQYRETDWNFVSRLLELEGIYFYFKHDADKHTLVLADWAGSHDTMTGYETIDYAIEEQDGLREHISAWTASRQLLSGAYAEKDFNFETPKMPLLSQLSAPLGNDHDDLELFDYPGQFGNSADGQTQVRVRLEEHQVDCEVFEGAGVVRGIGSGLLFTLANHPRDDQNAEYLVVSSWYDASVSGYESGKSSVTYRCSFGAIPSKVQYRSPTTTIRPRVEGPQTAIVVGPEGEEIWTDQYGRVKVQFFWDRYGKSDESSSCFVRVSQAWAGSQFGSMHIPRIGQEVIVDFLEGDPDRPIITGRVYNAANMPPYELPKNATQSGIKSRSSKGGFAQNANEIRFEDLKGQEELFIQAEKNETVVVKANQSVSVGANRSVSVGANESISVGANRATTVGAEDTLTVKKKHTGTYHLGRILTVDGADDNLTVNGQNKATTVHGEYNIVADKHFKVTQNSDSLLIEDKCTITSAGPITLDNGKCQVTLNGEKITLNGASEIDLVCGQASISLKKDGTVEISGQTKVSLSGGQGSIELAAAGATVSGPKCTISGSASTEISGAMVKIN